MTRVRYVNVLAACALLCALAPALFAGELTYQRAAAPWTAEEAARLAPQITPEFLREVALRQGPAAAASLAVKGSRVRGLLKRYKNCSLGRKDLAAAEKYLAPGFRSEINFFAGGGCGEFSSSASKENSGPDSASLATLEKISASGTLATREGSAFFFDGASGASGPAVPDRSSVSAADAIRSEGRSFSIPAPRLSKTGTAARVPPLKRHPQEPELTQGFFNRTAARWSSMRRENWAALRGGGLSGREKAAALRRTAVGAACGFLLWYTNFAAVETAAARLRRDREAGAGPRELRADAAKLAFHVGLMMIAPIPIANISAAVAAGRLWGFLVVGYVGVAIANRFYHFAD